MNARSSPSARRARPPNKSVIKPRALISIGTNSTRLLVLDRETTLAVESRGTRLGTGLQHTGRLDPDARARTLAAIGDYITIARMHDAHIACIATSAMRRASDGASFTADVNALIGAQPHILSGDEEATYSFLGATGKMSGKAVVGVLDVGGGSTELAVDVPARARERGNVAYTHSVEIGAVRLAERFPALLGANALDAAARADLLRAVRADVAAVLAPFAESPPPERLIVVGGSAFTAAAIVEGSDVRDGVVMRAGARADLLDMLLSKRVEDRRKIPMMRPQRADILPAGLAIIDEACRMLHVPDAVVSVDDLLAGYLGHEM